VTKLARPEVQPDFSLVLGGPLFQLFRRAHLSGDALEMLRRRVVIIAVVAWAPLLLLSVISGLALGDSVAIPFLHDIESHVRFLIALPILIAAELIVHRRIQPTVRQFVERRIVIPEELPKFQQAVDATLRLRNSVIGRSVAAGAGLHGGPLGVAQPDRPRHGKLVRGPGGCADAAHAGGILVRLRQRADLPVHSAALVPAFSALVFAFVVRISRLNLRLVARHPDKTAGLGFLGVHTASRARETPGPR